MMDGWLSMRCRLLRSTKSCCREEGRREGGRKGRRARSCRGEGGLVI